MSPSDGRRPGRPLRHDPARRDAGREHHAVARRQAARRADARRVRDAVHRGRLAGLEPQGHRVLRRGPDDALGDAPSSPRSGRPATAPTSRPTTRTCASWSRPRRRSSRSSASSWLLHVTEVLGATPAGEPRHGRRLDRLPRRPRPRGRLRRRALLRRLQGRTATMRSRRCVPRGRPARGPSSCATRTAAR